MQMTLRRIFDIAIIVALAFLIPRIMDFNSLTMSDYIFLALYVLIVILFIVNIILEIINRRGDNDE